MSLIVCLFIIMFLAMLIFGGLDILRDERNPLPKFENGDEHIEQIKVIKRTRKIILNILE